jgi:hypothetical protein
VTTDRAQPFGGLPVLLLGAGLVAGILGLGTVAGEARRVRPAEAPAAPGGALPDSLGFEVCYAGIGAEGADLIWRGRSEGPVPGQVIIRMEYAGAPADRGMPIWPVSVLLLFSADDYHSSFAAELSGSMNWRSGAMRVAGLVTEGARAGSSLEHRMDLVLPDYGGAATVRFDPRLALRRDRVVHQSRPIANQSRSLTLATWRTHR